MMHQSKARRSGAFIQIAGASLVAALLAACGGGGGGGGGGSTTGGTTIDPAGPLGTGPGGSCGGATLATGEGANGFTLGGCDRVANATPRYVFAFRDVDPVITVVDHASKSYRATLAGQLRGAQVNFTAAGEDACNNIFGSPRFFTVQSPAPSVANQPVAFLSSITQPFSGASSCQGSTITGGAAAVPLVAADVGTWEYTLQNGSNSAGTGNELYFGSWVARRTLAATGAQAPTGVPAAAVVFNGPDAAIGYVAQGNAVFSLSASINGVQTAARPALSFQPAVGGGTVQGLFEAFFTRNAQAGLNPDVQILNISFSGVQVAANGNFSGAVQGTTSTGAALTGQVTGFIVPANVSIGVARPEIVGRIRAEVASATAGVPAERIVIAFGATTP